ncbi:two-component sensor histidine kinase [Paenibacillus sp. 598K]|uniref:cache domain-containing sensor histidine kinase n=1 Tax=Paenibacillus sp. 598K TaxID=1117987 RepID=UPI000FFAC630|nr:sensor histidine kinase [Paenibacillus sp. 598K]GBF72308.1 two-component sensor histidine kinase [Paenibacillus sp. 598K]
MKAGARPIIGKLGGGFSRIRTVLLLSYFVIILLSIVMVGSVSFYLSSSAIKGRVESANLQLVRQIGTHLNNDFRSKRNLLLAPYYETEYIDGINAYPEMDARNQYLFRQKLENLYLKSFNATPISGFIRFQIYYRTGELLAASGDYKPWTPVQVRNADWFLRTVAEDGGVYFHGPSQGDGTTDTEATAYASSILIRDFSSPERFIVVRVEYGDELFQTMGRSDDLSAASRTLVLDTSDRLVYDSQSGQGLAVEDALLGRVRSGEGKFWMKGDGDEQFVSYRVSEATGWKVVLLTPRSEILGPISQIKTAVVVTALVAFAMTFVISVLFGRRITQPILTLFKSVNRIKRGDFSERVEIRRSDEIGMIAANFNAMQDELQHLIENTYVNQIKLREVELAMLYSQINPHFLYNTLDIIRAMADYHRASEIGEIAQALADMFRYNTRNRDEVVTLQEELDQIEAYMKIQRIRFDDKIGYEAEVDEALYSYPVLKMTLQPIVENAVFHGLERKRGKGTIRIAARREGDRFVLSIIDDGVGISERHLGELQAKLRRSLHSDASPDESGRGIGVRNVYARYAIRYGEALDFEIESRKGVGTCVTLSLPFEAEATLGQNLQHSESES